MSRFKIPLILFFVMFILFGMTSFFSGKSWTLTLFNAFISSILWSAFFFFSRVLLKRYLPDMFEDVEKTETQEEIATASNIDIRIGGDESSFEGLESMGQSVPDLKSDKVKKDETTVKEVSSSTSSSQVTDSSKVDSHNTVPSDSAFQPTKQYPLSNSDNGKAVNASESATENEIDPATDSKITEEELSEGLEKDVDRLEELPDLQEFVDSSHVGDTQTKGEELMSAGTQSFFETDLAENVTDTNLMANAIRTVLKREA